MKKKQICTLISIILQVLIAGLGIVALTLQIHVEDPENAVSTGGWDILRFFTNDGNIVAMILAVLNIILLVTGIFKKKDFTRIIHVFSLMSCVSEFLIFAVVIILLIPAYGISLIQGYSMIMFHVVLPVLSMVNYLLFTGGVISKRLSLTAVIPMVLYAIVSMTLVATKVWEGKKIPYPFLRIYDNPVWQSVLYFTGMVGGTALVSLLLPLLNKKTSLMTKSQ